MSVRLFLAGLVAIAEALTTGFGVKDDRCTPLLRQIAPLRLKAFAEYSLPRESDNLPENIEFDLGHGGSGCLGAIRADIDGDGQMDLALLMRHVHDRERSILVVFLSSTDRSYKLYTFSDVARNKLALSILPPDVYRRSASISDDFEQGEAHLIRSTRPGIGAGVIDSSEVAFFWTDRRRWRHVWISD